MLTYYTGFNNKKSNQLYLFFIKSQVLKNCCYKNKCTYIIIKMLNTILILSGFIYIQNIVSSTQLSHNSQWEKCLI